MEDAVADELRAYLQREEPEFYLELMRRDISNFVPDRTKAAEVKAVATRDECRACKGPKTTIRCSVCSVARYCNAECQRMDADAHITACPIDRLTRAALNKVIYSGDLDE